MSKIVTKSRGFCVTVYDYDDKIEFLKKFFDGAKYFCMGKEHTQSGIKHLQCFVQFENPRSCSGFLKMIKKSILNGANCRPAKEGEIAWQRMYCMKENNYFYEHGERGSQGKRNDLSDTRNSLIENGKMREIVDGTENFQSIRVCEKWLSYKERKRDFKPIVTWLYGPTGVGKSRFAKRISNPEDTWESGENLQWFDGYDAHEFMIFDDFRGSQCSYSKLLRILDRYPMQLPVKGGFRQILSKHIIITSHKSPEECYSGLDEGIDQLMRRIDGLYKVDKNGTDVMEQKSGVILSPDICSELKKVVKKIN